MEMVEFVNKTFFLLGHLGYMYPVFSHGHCTVLSGLLILSNDLMSDLMLWRCQSPSTAHVKLVLRSY